MGGGSRCYKLLYIGTIPMKSHKQLKGAPKGKWNQTLCIVPKPVNMKKLKQVLCLHFSNHIFSMYYDRIVKYP